MSTEKGVVIENPEEKNAKDTEMQQRIASLEADNAYLKGTVQAILLGLADISEAVDALKPV